MKIKTVKTRIFRPGEDLIKFVENYFPTFKEEDVLVITSKVVSLAEGRIIKKTEGLKKEDIIKKESDFFLAGKYAPITIKDGVVMMSAGIDESNANGSYILLPKDSFKTASNVRNYFIKKHKLKKFGVIITDSRSIPLRRGVAGFSVGYAGIKALKDYRKSKDIFGKAFHFSVVNTIDSLAVVAVLCMGEGKEQKPLALISEAPISFTDRINRNELKVKVKDDMYYPIFSAKIPD